MWITLRACVLHESRNMITVSMKLIGFAALFIFNRKTYWHIQKFLILSGWWPTAFNNASTERTIGGGPQRSTNVSAKTKYTLDIYIIFIFIIYILQRNSNPYPPNITYSNWASVDIKPLEHKKHIQHRLYLVTMAQQYH